MITERNFIVPIYDFKVEVTVFDYKKEVHDKYPEFIEDNMDASTIEYIGESKAKVLIPSYDYPTVVHELEHVKNLIWKDKGYRPQADNDEVDAYLLGYLFGRVDKIIKEHMKNRKK